jgi:hypothetical protein
MEWKVVSLECYPEHEGQENVVTTAHWTLTTIDGEYVGSAYGSASFTLDPEAEFIPFADLTETTIIGWVKNHIGEEQVEVLENSVTKQIEEQKNPPIVKPALPWA